ncbi:2-hydroxyacyl-CoA dehydratase subunit D [Chloroflexota bacterium]
MVETAHTENSLEELAKLWENRSSKARELREQGRKIVGYFCCYLPVEILTAANIVPYRITGNLRDPVTVADVYCDPGVCPYLKSCFDMAMKGEHDFLDGWVTVDSCDSMWCMFKPLEYNVRFPFTYFLDVPVMFDQASIKFFKEELALFRNAIEGFTQSKVSDESLLKAIRLHNRNRYLLRELYQLRKPEPPLLSGSEVTRILLAVMSVPVEDANQLLEGAIAEAKERQVNTQHRGIRLLIYGPEIDDPMLHELIEDVGATVVTDDTCIGSRFFRYDVEETPNPLDGLTHRYLSKVYCAKTIRGQGEGGWRTRQADLEERFGHIRDFAKDYNVSGVILYIMRLCDNHQYDAPDLRDYLEREGFPVLHIESDYTLAALGALRTRLQAFVETIS